MPTVSEICADSFACILLVHCNKVRRQERLLWHSGALQLTFNNF